MARTHPNVLKVKKQTRMRRAYLKSYFGEIKVPRAVSKSGVPDEMQALFNYRQRGSTPEFDPFLDAIFPGVKHESTWRSTPTAAKVFKEGIPLPNEGEDNKLNGRKYSLSRAEQEKVIDLATSEADQFILVHEGGITKTRITLMYSSKGNLAFFIETCYHPGSSYMKKSMIYTGSGAKDRAKFDYRNKRVEWYEYLPLNSLTPDSPSG